MKKLMTFACAVALAAVAQAGAVKWSATQLDASPAGAYTATTTYIAYLFDASATELSTVTGYLTKVGGADWASFTGAAVDSNTATYSTTKEVMTFSAKTYGDFSQGDTFSGFLVVLDADSTANAKNFLVATKGEDTVLTTTAFGKTGDKILAWGSQTGNTWTAVPEPTSGLLMLLGMAGLALRRKQK